MYQSKYYTCEEIDERLLKGYYDDAVSKGYPGTLDQFKLELASQDAVNLDILNNYTGYTSSEAISKIKELYPTISHPLTFIFLDKTYNRERRFKYKGAGPSSNRRNYSDDSNYIFTLAELNGAEGATDIKGLLYEISSIGFSGSAIVIDGNMSYYCGQLTIFGDNMGHVVNQVLITNNLLSDDGTTISSSHSHTRTFQYERFLAVSGDSWVDREGNPVARLTNSKWYPSDYDLQKQVDPIELNDYASANKQLPRTFGTFTIGGYLAHSRSINHNNEVYLIFCGQHSGATGNTGSKYILYKENTTSAGTYTFNVQYDQANVPDWVKRAFNEATATDSYMGLMSSDMFTKLRNTVPDACVTCSTAAATAEKVITVNGFMSLPAQGGGSIKVKFTNANTAANPTLNISGTGAKPLYFGDEKASAENTWEAGSIVDVFYDGTKYTANSNNYKVLKDMGVKMNNMQGQLTAILAGAKLSISFDPSVVYIGTQTSVKVTTTLSGGVIAEKLTLTDSSGVIKEGTRVSTLSNTDNYTLNADKNFVSRAEFSGASLTANGTLSARHPIYCGFATAPTAITNQAHKLSPRTSASGTYTDTATQDNVKYFILVPTGITVPSNFTMGGAPYVMEKGTFTYQGVSYTILSSGATYNTGSTVNIIVS